MHAFPRRAGHTCLTLVAGCRGAAHDAGSVSTGRLTMRDFLLTLQITLISLHWYEVLVLYEVHLVMLIIS